MLSLAELLDRQTRSSMSEAWPQCRAWRPARASLATMKRFGNGCGRCRLSQPAPLPSLGFPVGAWGDGEAALTKANGPRIHRLLSVYVWPRDRRWHCKLSLVQRAVSVSAHAFDRPRVDSRRAADPKPLAPDTSSRPTSRKAIIAAGSARNGRNGLATAGSRSSRP